MLNQLQDYYRRYKESKNYKYDLDALLDQANPEAPLDVRLLWLVDLMQWVRHQVVVKDNSEIANNKLPSARIKFLLQVFERNETWKANTSKAIRSILRDLNAVDLFTEIGLSDDSGLLRELKNRIANKIMPERPLSEGLNNLFTAIFPEDDDAEWFLALSDETLSRVIDFLHYGEDMIDPAWIRLQNDLKDALLLLTSQVRAIGLSASMRKRMDYKELQDLPFFGLTKFADDLLQAYDTLEPQDYQVIKEQFHQQILLCVDGFNEVYRHLDIFGVSTTVVYLLETAQAKLKRIDDLINILSHEKISVDLVRYIMAQLIEENADKQSIGALLSQNFRLMARKIVDRSAETGEHYITKNRTEYFQMFRRAMGGGAITSLTVLMKLVISTFSLPLFVGGLLSSVNYAVSFLVIQFQGFTLATKQPAMTGPALATKLQQVNNGAPIDSLVDEIVRIIRTQMIGIIGNVSMVVPCIMVFDFLVQQLIGSHILAKPAQADYVFQSTNVFGLTLLYAAFTGILLWLSSVFAGFMDNWFYLNKLGKVLALNRRLNFIFGKSRSLVLARFLENNISNIAGNVSLGVMLGLVPEIFSFFGIGLQVRHVTLSSGTFALGFMHYGLESLKMWPFYSALIGILFIGLLNVSVSFTMAFFVAIRSRNIRGGKKREIYQAILYRFRTNPLRFLIPPKEKA
jgi:site-specific recombinase